MMTTPTLLLLAPVLTIFVTFLEAATIISPACFSCRPPTFPPTPQGRPLWLPYCVDGKSLNFCDAVCTGKQVSQDNQGSCEDCETRCGMVFLPVCTLDQSLIFPNKCQANCAGVETVDCLGLFTVIPGKTKLPPSDQLPLELQSFGSKHDEDIEDEDP